MLRSFSAQHYRNLTADELKFEPLNILLGPNNSGKSNFIDAIGFFASLLKGSAINGAGNSAFLDAIEERGYGDLLDRACQVPGQIEMKWVLSSKTTADLTYELNFNVGRSEDFPSAFYIRKEQLRYAEPAPGKEAPFRFIDCQTRTLGEGDFSVRDHSTNNRKLHRMKVDQRDTVFHQMKTLLKDKKFYEQIYPQFEHAADFVRGYFEGFHAYASSRIDPKLVAAGTRRDLQVKKLDRQGIELVNVLRHIDQNYDLEEYTVRLRELLPGLRKIKIVDVSDEQQQILLEMAQGHRFKLKEMSDGTIKAMLIALLLTTPVRMTLLTIDEPELNFHPAWLSILANWFKDCRSAEQIILSTHSPDLLDKFTDVVRQGKAALFVAGSPSAGITRIDPAKLDSFFNEGWELGDLYRVGEPQLGGWPW